MTLAYCNICVYEWKDNVRERPEICPSCNKNELTVVERMCGFIAYTRIHGESRLNDAKMAEIKDRVSM